MATTGRAKILRRLRDKIASGKMFVGGRAGTGLSAKCEAARSIESVVIYTSGLYRMAGRGSFAGHASCDNANEIAVDMGREVLPVVKNVPVPAGVDATVPFCITEKFPDELKATGF